MATCPEVSIETILGSECIGDSLPKINGNFSALQTAVCDLVSGGSSGTVTNVTGTTPIIITGTSTTTPNVTLDEAFIARLTTLENNMNNIGNHPYLEYAWATTPAGANQSLTADVETVLNLTTLVRDTDSINVAGYPTANQIKLLPGKYHIKGEAVFGSNVNFLVLIALKNNTTGLYETGGNIPYLTTAKTEFETVVKVTTTGGELFSVTAIPSSNSTVSNGGLANSTYFSSTIAGYNRRVMLKIWKVG